MSGHNKWSKIKRKKGAEDAKRSKEFSRIIKEIMVAVKEGDNSDPEFNPRLRTAITNAKGVNMPKDNIERAIKKASEAGGEGFTEPTYEGYGPGGIAIFVECTTDNTNRTVSSVRSIFSKHGGNMATNGSVDFLFDRKGVFEVKQGDREEDEMMLELIDAGAEDVDTEEGVFYVTTKFEDFGPMQNQLEKLGMDVSKAELQRIPKTTTVVPTNEAKKAYRLIEKLDEDDDVNAVYHNLELTDELVAELAE